MQEQTWKEIHYEASCKVLSQIPSPFLSACICFKWKAKRSRHLDFSDCHSVVFWLFWPHWSFCEIGVRPAFHMGPLRATELLEIKVGPPTVCV